MKYEPLFLLHYLSLVIPYDTLLIFLTFPLAVKQLYDFAGELTLKYMG